MAVKTLPRALLMSLARRPATASRVSATSNGWRKRAPLRSMVQALPVASVPARVTVTRPSNAAAESPRLTTAAPAGTSTTSEKARALLIVMLSSEADAT